MEVINFVFPNKESKQSLCNLEKGYPGNREKYLVVKEWLGFYVMDRNLRGRKERVGL